MIRKSLAKRIKDDLSINNKFRQHQASGAFNDIIGLNYGVSAFIGNTVAM